MVKIRWSNKSLYDLKNIFDYIAQDSKNYVNIQVKRIKLRTQQLKIQPLSGRIVPEFNNENVRELIEGNYRIVHLIKEDQIFILTIHHASKMLV